MKKVLGRNIYDVSGVFYDQRQKLTVSLASSNKIVFERLNATAFKEGLLDIYGPSVLLSQIKANQAEKLMLKTENRANRKAKMRGERPPSGAEMDELIKRAILSDEQLLNDVKIAFVSAKFAFEELYSDYERLVPKLFESKQIHLMDLDEENNRIFISVKNKEGLETVEAVAKRLNINMEKIYVSVQPQEEPISDLDSGTMQDYNRPIRGGLYIAVPKHANSDAGCSIGVVAKREETGEVGFLTASHCTDYEAKLDSECIGGFPQPAYQVDFGSYPPLPTTDDDLIGQETSDAILQTDDTICSDSAFFTFEDDVSYDTAINKGQGNGSNVLKTSGRKTWYSLRIDSNSLANEIVYKVGRNTGQTRGKVKQTCVFVSRGDGWEYHRTCQDIVNNYDEGIRFQWKGDSGAATFYTTSANSRFAWIRGISWGRSANYENCHEPDYSDCTGVVDAFDAPVYLWDHYVSPISNVECDHGEIFVHYNDIP